MNQINMDFAFLWIQIWSMNVAQASLHKVDLKPLPFGGWILYFYWEKYPINISFPFFVCKFNGYFK